MFTVAGEQALVAPIRWPWLWWQQLRAPERNQPRAQTTAAGQDAAVVERARRGDRRAFDELYRAHVDRVWARLTRLLGPDPEREDLTQQAFMHAFRALDRFRGESSFATFLFRIVTNIAVDHMRRNKGRPVAVDDGWVCELACGDLSPEARTAREQTLRALWGCLEAIKPKKRIAFLLRVVEGLSLEEIATLTDSNVPTVAQRVRHAQMELAKLLEKRNLRAHLSTEDLPW